MIEFQDYVDYFYDQPIEVLLVLSILGLVLFMFGLLLGWLIQKSKTARFRKRAEQIEKEKKDLQERLAAADEEQKKLARELINITTEKDDSLVQQREVRKNLEYITAELRSLQSTNEQLTATNQSYSGTIEDLNDQIIGLKTRNEQLLGGGKGTAGAVATEVGHGSDLEQRLRVLEERLEKLAPATEAEPVPELGGPSHEVTIGQAWDEVSENHDDLTRISSIGPFNQRKLNEIGVTTFRQIADWKDGDLDDYAARIGYVAQLMREEDWIGQARRLAESVDGEQESKPSPRVGLQVVEGIGPRIEGVLREAGVTDLQTLADTPVAELEAILEQSGGGMALHDPADWPRQAALAAAGNWRELQELQDAR